jgi:hypothetical protein
MRSYEVYEIMHMIPQRRFVTVGLDCVALYGIVRSNVTRLKSDADCPEA